jgi:hypothetical protein
VEFYAGSNLIGKDSDTTDHEYSTTWDSSDFPDGKTSLRAVAYDAAGNHSGATLSVVVANTDNTPPEINWIAPATGSTVNGQATLIVTAADETALNRVEFYAGDNLIGQGNNTSGDEYETMWDSTKFPDGKLTLKAVAYDAAGNNKEAPLDVKVANIDRTPPTIKWVTPNDGDNVAGQVDLSVIASDDKGVTKVELYAGSDLLKTIDNNSPTKFKSYKFTWDTTGRPDGSVGLTARAYDAVGHATPANIRVTVRNQGVPPELAITAPGKGATVGLQFAVGAQVTKKQGSFTWVPEDGHNLQVKIYDYRGSLVTEAYLTDDGKDTSPEPQDDSNFIGRRVIDLGNVPADTYTVVVEGTVEVNGNPIKLSQSETIDVAVDSNLPPALVLFAPMKGVTFGNAMSIAGRVTDDGGKVHALEFRMVCNDHCGSGSGPEDQLLQYLSDPYGLFSTEIPLDGAPYIDNGTGWRLRVVAIDSANHSLRNLIEVPVNVDRTADFSEFANASWSVTEVPPTDPDAKVKPASATWSLDLSGVVHDVRYVLVVRKDGQIVEEIKGTALAGGTVPYQRSFGENDQGTWEVRAILQDASTGVQVTKESPSVGVTKKKSNGP